MSPDQTPNLTRAAYLSTVFLRALRDGKPLPNRFDIARGY